MYGDRFEFPTCIFVQNEGIRKDVSIRAHEPAYLYAFEDEEKVMLGGFFSSKLIRHLVNCPRTNNNNKNQK